MVGYTAYKVIDGALVEVGKKFRTKPVGESLKAGRRAKKLRRQDVRRGRKWE